MLRKFFISIVLILSFMSLALATPQADKVSAYVLKAVQEYISKTGLGWVNWERGVKEEYGGTLKKLSVTMKIIDEQNDENQVFLVLEFTFTASILNKSKDKERLIITRALGVLFERESLKIISYLPLGEDRKLLPGWNGRDI